MGSEAKGLFKGADGLGMGRDRRMPHARPHPVDRGRLRVAGELVVVGQNLRLIVGGVREQLVQHARRAPVKFAASGEELDFVHGVAQQRVMELVGGWRARLPEDPAAFQKVEMVLHLCFRARQQIVDHLCRGGTAENGEHLHHLALVGKRIKAGHEKVVERRRHRDRVGWQIGAVIADDHPRQLPNVKRHAVAPLGDQTARRFVETAARECVDQLVTRVGVDRPELDDHARLSRHRSRGLPSSGKYKQRPSLVGDTPAQQLEGRWIGPMQILHDEEGRTFGAQRVEPR